MAELTGNFVLKMPPLTEHIPPTPLTVDVNEAMKQIVPKKNSRPLLMFTSDWHLCAKAPPARRNELNWFEAMRRPIRFMVDYCNRHNVPLIIAGDIFDKPDPEPEVISFAVEELRRMIHHPACAIPGQHDLLFHNYEDITKTAYWTLVVAGVIHNLQPNRAYTIGKSVVLQAFPWHHILTGPTEKPSIEVYPQHYKVAVAHHYVWDEDHTFPNAPIDSKVDAIQKRMAGFDLAIFGDNHKGFYKLAPHDHMPMVVNCGGMMLRNSDEIGRCPSAFILKTDEDSEIAELDHADDKFDPVQKPEEINNEKEEEIRRREIGWLLTELNVNYENRIDFKESIRRVLKADRSLVTPRARKILMEAVADADN